MGICLYTWLIIGFIHQAQSLVANPRHQRPVDGYRVPLESFRIVYGRDVRTSECAARTLQNRETMIKRRAILPVTPETIMHHSQSTSGPFVIVCETFGEEEFHDGRTGGGLHPNE